MERTLCFKSLPGRLACSGFSALVPQEKVFFLDESFIDRACSVTIAGHYPLFFCVFVLDFASVCWKNASSQKHKKELGQYPDILTSRLVKNAYMLNEYHAFFQHVARSLSSALISQGCAFLLLSFSSFGPFLMHKAAFARDLSYLAPKDLTIPPH